MVAGKNESVAGLKRSSGRIHSGGGELRGPDRVELENVGLADVGVEPLHVELMALVGGVRSGPLHDPDIGVLLHESRELAPQDRAFGAECAARKDHRDGTAGGG